MKTNNNEQVITKKNAYAVCFLLFFYVCNLRGFLSMKIQFGRDKKSSKSQLDWLMYIKKRIIDGKPTTETDRYKLGGNVNIESVNEQIAKIKKELL